MKTKVLILSFALSIAGMNVAHASPWKRVVDRVKSHASTLVGIGGAVATYVALGQLEPNAHVPLLTKATEVVVSSLSGLSSYGMAETVRVKLDNRAFNKVSERFADLKRFTARSAD